MVRCARLLRPSHSSGLKATRSALALAISAALTSPAWALPQGAQVVNGQVSISQPSAGAMQINASNGAIINWQKFGIGAGELTQFVQPSATSAVLNRVVGAEASALLGQLKANGNVFLINPNGIVIGAGARIDTNSFIASTLDMADADFLAGKLRFFENGNAGRLINQGAITAGPGGRVVLIAPDITNSGIVRADDGQILLAAGRRLEIASLDLDGVTFEIQAPSDTALNLGQLLADNGAIGVFAGTLHQSGVIQASRMQADAQGNIVLVAQQDATLHYDSQTRADGSGEDVDGGTIVVKSAQGTTYLEGALSASSAAAAGGSIQVLGQRVALRGGSTVYADGATAGGSIHVGGGYQGSAEDIQNAERTYVDGLARLSASAISNGDGGSVIVWADENTRYLGSITATGGADGGNGGFVEVSGKTNLQFDGTVDLSAPKGSVGTLLLDPLDIVVADSGGAITAVVDEFADFSANVLTISPTALNAVAGNVTLQAERDIYFNSALTLSTAGAGLTATAGGTSYNAGSIYLNNSITTTGGSVSLYAASLGVAGGGTVTTNGGALSITTNGALTSYGGDLNAGTGAITLVSETGYIEAYGLVGNTANLSAQTSVYAYVDLTGALSVQAGDYVGIYNQGSGSLQVGSIVSGYALSIDSSPGLTQTSTGLLKAASYVDIGYVSGGGVGSSTNPIKVESPYLQLYSLQAPAHVQFVNTPTLSGLELSGSVAALGSSTFTGAGNISSFSLGTSSGSLTLSLNASAGLDDFSVTTTDGGITVGSLAAPDAYVSLYDVQGDIAIGSLNARYLSIYYPNGGVEFGTTVATNGVYVYANNCSDNSCVSNVTGTSVQSPSGSISIYVYDSGDFNIPDLQASNSVLIYLGNTSSVWNGTEYVPSPTTNSITLNTVTAGSGVNVYLYGAGNLTVNSISAGGTINVDVGGSVTAGALLSSGSAVFVTAADNLTFGTVDAAANITLKATAGSVQTDTDDTGLDVLGTRTVSITAGQVIGNQAYTNPLDVQVGGSYSLTLNAGGNVGTPSNPVTVSPVTGGSPAVSLGTLFLSSTGGTYNVDTGPAVVTSVFLSASAAGIDAGDGAADNTGSAVLTTGDYTYTATVAGAGVIALNDLVRTSGTTLNTFSFEALGSSLALNDVDLNSNGADTLVLSAAGFIEQSGRSSSVGGGDNIVANSVELTAETGNITVGATVSGSDVTMTAGGLIHIGEGSTDASNLAIVQGGTSAFHDITLNAGGAVRARDVVTGGDINVTGTSLTMGTFTSVPGGLSSTLGDITITAGSLININALSAPGGITLTGLASYTGANRVISASELTIHATGNVLTALGVPNDTITGYDAGSGPGNLKLTLISDEGGVGARAANTNNLTIQAAGGFAFIGDTWLDNLDITADWEAATASDPSYVRGINDATNGHFQEVWFEKLTTDLSITAEGYWANGGSPAPYWNVNYQDTSATALNGGSSVDLLLDQQGTGYMTYTFDAPSDIYVHSTASNGAGVEIYTGDVTAGGDIHLGQAGGATSLGTNGVSVRATTSGGGDVYVSSVQTGGGWFQAEGDNVIVEDLDVSGSASNDVWLTALSGSVTPINTGSINVNMGATANGGNLHVTASDSIGIPGATPTPLWVSGVGGDAYVKAHNTIAVRADDSAFDLLSVWTWGSGTGSLTLSGTNNFADGSTGQIYRLGGTLYTGNLNPFGASNYGGAQADFTLVAEDGNIHVADTIRGMNNLTLQALSTTVGEGNITISPATSSQPQLLLSGGGSLLVSAAGDISIAANQGVSVRASYIGSINMFAGGNLTLAGGSGAGGYVDIGSTGFQTIDADGSIYLLGGGGSDAYASFISSGSGQTVGSSYTYLGNDPTDDIAITGGAGSGSYAGFSAVSTQNVKAAGSILLTANVGDAFIYTSGSTQNVGQDIATYYDATNAIVLQGGSVSGSDAYIQNNLGSQNVRTYNFTYNSTTAQYEYGSIELMGGIGDAYIQASSGQSIHTNGRITLTGAAAGTATDVHITNTTSGTQTVAAHQGITLSGGAGTNYVAIAQEGTGTQAVTSFNGNLLLQYLVSGTGWVGLQSWTGDQTINVNALTISNQAGGRSELYSGGNMTINADTLDLTSSTTASTSTNTADSSAPGSQILVDGDLTLNLVGDGFTAGSAYLNVVNNSSVSGSIARIYAAGSMQILMDYAPGSYANYQSMGLMQVGATTANGASMVESGGDVTLVVGGLTLQGGQTTAASASLIAPSTAQMDISALTGSVLLLGGSNGLAEIDPQTLNLTSPGAVTMQGGAAASATATITATTFNLASSGGYSLNSTAAPAPATITATTFFSATGAAGAPAPAPAAAPVAASVSEPALAAVTELVALADGESFVDPYGNVFVVNEEGELVLDEKRQLAQCY